MKAETLVVTRRCNQRCGFCDRVDPASVDPALPVLERALRDARARGAETIVLSGGEPTLRPDLLELVRAARAQGARAVRLETNGTRIGPEAARRLREAGVGEVQISFVTADPALHARLVSPEGRPQEVLRGMKACVDAGMAVRVRLPIARDLPAAVARLRGIAEAVPGVGPFVLAPVGAGERTLGAGRALDPAALADEVAACVEAADKLRIELEVDPEHVLAPCALELPTKARRILAGVLRERDGEPCAAHEACGACALAPRCTIGRGQLDRALGGRPPAPIADARAYLRPGKSPGARLRVLGPREVERFFHVDYEYGVDVSEPTSRIGIIYRCNQTCTFCELADMDVEIAPEKVREALVLARARGSQRVILTGGEPTLSPHMLDHIAFSREQGFTIVELQTNAVLFDRPGLAAQARAAGLTRAQISLHGPDAAVSDALTAAPGTHARTLRGVDALLDAGVECVLNHLIFSGNCRLLTGFVRMVADRWGDHRDAFTIQFHSPRNEFADREEALRHVPRYSEYARELRLAIDLARELGVRIHDLQDPTGIPSLCVLAADETYLGPILEQGQAPRFHAWESPWLTRVAACSSCELSARCMGVPRHYLELYGDAEFAPLRARGSA